MSDGARTGNGTPSEGSRNNPHAVAMLGDPEVA
jgi:hypothetical protein